MFGPGVSTIRSPITKTPKIAPVPGIDPRYPARGRAQSRVGLESPSTEAQHEHPRPLHRSTGHEHREVRRDDGRAIEAVGRVPAPTGSSSTSPSPSGGSFRVSEIWESKEKFEAFSPND